MVTVNTKNSRIDPASGGFAPDPIVLCVYFFFENTYCIKLCFEFDCLDWLFSTNFCSPDRKIVHALMFREVYYVCYAQLSVWQTFVAMNVQISTEFSLRNLSSFMLFYRAMLHRARLGWLSVCLSVRPSVRSWRLSAVIHDHTGWNTSKIISRLISLRFMLWLTQHERSGASGTPQN